MSELKPPERPRRDRRGGTAGLSTIGAAAMLLPKLEHNPKIEAALNISFAKMLERYRAVVRDRKEVRGGMG
jgi:hypothetical protein